MRKFMLFVTAALTLSGLALAYQGWIGLEGRGRQAVSLGHIWGGVMYLAIFALYGWDHINGHRRWLLRPAMVSATGYVQTLAGITIILSGVVLMLYGNQAWPLLHTTHHVLTYLLATSILLHYLSPKRWRAAR